MAYDRMAERAMRRALPHYLIGYKNQKNFIKTLDKLRATAYNVIEHLKKYSIIRRATDMQYADKNISAALPDDDTLYELADLFKMFGDPTRAKILSCLQIRDMYVGELAEALGMSDSAVSHQLRVLRGAKLVKGTKEGKEVKYSLDDDHVTKIMECGLAHVNEDR